MARSGVGEAASFTTITLRPLSGPLPLKVLRTRPTKDGSSVVTRGEWSSGEQVATQNVPRRHRMFPRGAGWSSRPGILEEGVEWDGFAESENACVRFGFVCPSGEQLNVDVPAAWGQPQEIISFNNDLFFIFANQIAWMDSGTGPLTPLYSLPGDFFYNALPWNGALRVATTCSHLGGGAGHGHSFVTITPSGGSYTVTQPDATYAAGPPPQLRLLETVFWEFEGVGGYRLVGQDTDFTFRWMIAPNGDPYDDANWGPPVQVGDRTNNFRKMAASHDTVWFGKLDGVYAVTDANASAGGMNLTPYWGEQLDDFENRIHLHYWGQWLVASHAYGIELIDVNSWQVRDAPRPAQIGYGRPNNTSLAGAVTAFTTDSGWLVAAMRGQAGNAFRATVLYGTARRRESPVGGVTEVDWFPEIGPFPQNRDIVAMSIHTPPESGRPYLWLGFKDATNQPYLTRVELFTGGNPLADGAHRYHTTSSITFTDEHWAARSAIKGAVRGELAVRHCGSGRKVDFYAAVGAGDPFGSTPSATIDQPVEAATFALPNVRGHVIRTKAVLTSTPDIPVVIDEMGLKANLGFPLRRTGTWLVEVSDATEGALPTQATPSTVEARLVSLCESVEAFAVDDDEGTRFMAVLTNVLPWQRVDAPTNDLGVHQKTRLLEVGYQEVMPGAVTHAVGVNGAS